MTGTIIYTNEKGFGFIKPSDGSGQVFFHARSLLDLTFGPHLQEQRVEFEVTDSPRGVRAEVVCAAKS